MAVVVAIEENRFTVLDGNRDITRSAGNSTEVPH